jgi:hypothetical protein
MLLKYALSGGRKRQIQSVPKKKVDANKVPKVKKVSIKKDKNPKKERRKTVAKPV